MDMQSPNETPAVFVQSRPFTIKMGESCFGLQTTDADSVQHTTLTLYQEEGGANTIIQAEGQVVATTVEPIMGVDEEGKVIADRSVGAYIGVLTQCQDDVFIVTLIIEGTDGIFHEQRSVSVECDRKDDLVLSYHHHHNCVFITSNRKNGTLARIDNIRKGVAA